MLHNHVTELRAAQHEMQEQRRPGYGNVIIKLKFDGADILGAGWMVSNDPPGTKQYFDVSTPLIEMIAKMQEGLIEQVADPLKTLLLTLHPDGNFTVDATYEDPKTPQASLPPGG